MGESYTTQVQFASNQYLYTFVGRALHTVMPFRRFFLMLFVVNISRLKHRRFRYVSMTMEVWTSRAHVLT